MSSPLVATTRENGHRFPGMLVLTVVLLFLAANAKVLWGLIETWWISSAETGHGFIALPLAFYVAWDGKEEWLSQPYQRSNWLVIPLLLCVVTIPIATLAQWIFVSQFALWVSIVSSVWYLFGWRRTWALRFPFLLLLLSIPPPSFLYTRLTFEMQLLASRLGEVGLEILGYSVLREGNILRMVGENLSVAEACSGIRSLTTLVFFVIVYGHFLISSSWHRWLLVACAIPVAVLANGLRIITTGVLAQYDRQLAHGVTHEISGYITLLAGGVVCIMLQRWLQPQSKEVQVQ